MVHATNHKHKPIGLMVTEIMFENVMKAGIDSKLHLQCLILDGKEGELRLNVVQGAKSFYLLTMTTALGVD